MTIEFLEHCKKNFIHLILRTPNCSTIEQFEDLFNFWMLKNAKDVGWYKVCFETLCLHVHVPSQTSPLNRSSNSSKHSSR